MSFNIEVNIHCSRPPWAINSLNKDYQIPSYRLYVNGELFTERTWIWSDKTHLRESLWIDCDIDTYEIMVEPVTVIDQQASFRLSDLVVEGHEYNLLHSEDSLLRINSINTIIEDDHEDNRDSNQAN